MVLPLLLIRKVFLYEQNPFCANLSLSRSLNIEMGLSCELFIYRKTNTKNNITDIRTANRTWVEDVSNNTDIKDINCCTVGSTSHKITRKPRGL